MKIQTIMKNKNMSIYKLSKSSKVPYATINDIYNGKTKIEKCSAETLYRISHALNVSMEDILAPVLSERSTFDNFKSTVCHQLKEKGDIGFVIDTLEKDNIREYYEREWYPECLYLLAMLDYISKENSIPICEEYDDIRKIKLEKPVYPSGILLLSAINDKQSVLESALKSAIPEFLKYNIVESEIRNVI